MEYLRGRAGPYADKIPRELFEYVLEHILKRNGGSISSWSLFNSTYAKRADADIEDARRAVSYEGSDFDAFFVNLKERDAKAAADQEQKRAKDKEADAAKERLFHNITRGH
jgi:hypothetical protein